MTAAIDPTSCSDCDNKATISIAHDPIHHDLRKHINVDRHSIKEKIDERTINITYIPSSDQTVDILAKALYKPMFKKLVDKLGMLNMYIPA